MCAELNPATPEHYAEPAKHHDPIAVLFARSAITRDYLHKHRNERYKVLLRCSAFDFASIYAIMDMLLKQF